MLDRTIALAALLGLTAGVGHGIISHQAGLPMSLSDQILQSMHLAESDGFR